MSIKIKGLNYKDILKDINLEIKEKDFITIVGSSASGKTTLAKLLSGIIPNDNVLLDDKKIEIDNPNISIILDDVESNFIYETVIENLVFPLENLNLNKKEINTRIEEIISYLKMENLKELKVSSLSGGEKELVALASALITDPKILILDEPFAMLDGKEVEDIFKLLKKINRDKKTTIIYLTSDIETCIYGKKIAVLADKTITNIGTIKNILNDEKSFKKAKQKLPFMADLSKKLQYYNLVDDIILEESKMVDALWK